MVVSRLKVTLEEFLDVLVKYRDKFYLGCPAEERYYIEVFEKVSNVLIRKKAQYISSILLFLNRWKCRFSRKSAPDIPSQWIDREANALEWLSTLSIDTYNKSASAEIDRLYESLK